MSKNNSYSIISDFNKTLRELSSDISDIKTGLLVNANTTDHLSERLSWLEEKMKDIQKHQPSLAIGNIIALIVLILMIIGIFFAAYEWRIDARLATNNQHVSDIIDKKISNMKEGK
jgi:hypothetical protein